MLSLLNTKKNQRLPLSTMNIAVFVGKMLTEFPENDESLIPEILYQLALDKKEHRFFLISDSPEKIAFPSLPNFQILNIGLKANNWLLKKYRWDIKLSGILKTVKAEVLISFDKLCSFSLPQILVILEGKKVTIGNLKKSKLILANSVWHKNELRKTKKIKEEKIVPLSPFANKIYKPATESVKENIKAKYFGGKAYFLYPEKNIKEDTFISILKSFSHFKKRQQSSMKLMILSKPNEKSLKSLSSYKYRNDVVLTEKIKAEEEADITGASYAVLISETNRQPVLNTLKALQSEIPVIAEIHPAIQEIAGEAVIYSKNESVNEMGDKMIRMYTDETLRDEQIRKGRIAVKNYSAEHAADLLWSCIIKAVK